MALRILLLRLLLVAAFFNAAIGTPLHEAAHLKEPATLLASTAGTIDDAEGESSERAGTPDICVWCAVHGAQGMALMLVVALALRAEAPGPHPLRQAADFVPAGWRWRFAARDPPPATH